MSRRMERYQKSQRTFSNNNYELNLLLTLEEKNDFIQWFKEFEYIYIIVWKKSKEN